MVAFLSNQILRIEDLILNVKCQVVKNGLLLESFGNAMKKLIKCGCILYIRK